MIVVAVLLGIWTFNRIASLEGAAAHGAWQVLTSGGDIQGTAVDVGLSLWHSAVHKVWEAFAALVLIEFLYQFVALAWPRRTLGKLLLDMQVRRFVAGREPVAGLGKGRAAGRAAVTALTDTGLYALACGLLLDGRFALSMLCWLLAVAAFWGNALPILGPRHRTLNDLLVGTVVVATQIHQVVLRGAAQGGRAAVGGIRGAADHQRVRQALESDRARQARETGRQAAARGRGVWDRSKKWRPGRRGPEPPALPPGGQVPPAALPPPPPPQQIPLYPPYGQPYAPQYPPPPPGGGGDPRSS